MSGPGSQLYHGDRVYQAQGVVSVQADCSLDDARRRMQERARDFDLTLNDIAEGVLAHRVWFRGEPSPED